MRWAESLVMELEVDMSLERPLRNYIVNGRRLLALAMLPGEISAHVAKLTACTTMAAHAVFGTHFFSEAMATEARLNEINQKTREYFSTIDPVPLPGGPLRTERQRGAQMIDDVSTDSPIANMAIESLLSNVIVQAWTLFETCACDLWITSVNLRPESLGKKAASAQPYKVKGKEESEKPNDTDGVVIDWEMLAHYKFDLSESMGTMFKVHRRFDFDRLAKIGHAYKAIFGKEVDACFSSDGEDSIFILEALRNLFVHTGGVIDHVFMSRVKKHSTFSKMKLDSRFIVQGPMAAKYLDVCFSHCKKLFEFVNKWIKANPK